MTFQDYQTQASQTAIYPASAKITYPALGLAGEAGEVANKVKKILRDSRGNLTDEARHAIGAEIGDVLWYLAALANDLGLHLSDLAEANLRKLLDRQARNTLQGSGDTR